ncbi:GroES-like protein [Rhodocollybia butyracea]|uniref:GroES-like protein n=1 Tax=Rhodocollybia butyracea TaxID=206335 RepID=A0A9P5TX58_9AGAR|nr:GroES-like protein [Rhodocollybia butyracea]
MLSLPKTYKAAVVHHAGGNFEIVEKPLVAPTAGSILVKVLACGVCHSDSLVKLGVSPLPRVAGHEIVGDVVAVPDCETRWKLWLLQGGDFITCSNEAINGVTQDGGYAEYVILRTEAVLLVPDSLDPAEAAPLLCAGITTFNALRNVEGLKGNTTLIVFFLTRLHSGVGHLGLQYAKQMGFKVVALSQSDAKKELAIKLGADIYLNGSEVNQVEELMKLGGAKVILATALTAKLFSKAHIQHHGNNAKTHYYQGWPAGHARDTEEAIEFAQKNNIVSMIEKFTLEQVNEAFAKMQRGQTKFRAVLIPGV